MISLSEYIVKIVYAGYTIEGDNTTELIVHMKELFFTYGDVKIVFGVRKQAAIRRVKLWKLSNPERYLYIKQKADLIKEFRKLYLRDGMSLFEIAHHWNCPKGFVTNLKQRVAPSESNRTIILIHRRHKRLCRLLFGARYNPGAGFIPFIKKQLPIILTAEEYDSLCDYYITGITNIEEATRAITIQRLGRVLTYRFNIEQLVDEEIICLARNL